MGPACFGYSIGADDDDLSFDERTARRSCPSAWWWIRILTGPGSRARRGVPWDQTIIYEAHVRGFTRLHPQVPPARRGTFAGLGTQEVVQYVKSLGVTSIELLPIHTLHRRQSPAGARLTNYWG